MCLPLPSLPNSRVPDQRLSRRRRVRFRHFGFGLLLLAWGCSYVPFSGGALQGELRPALTDWQTVADTQIIQLETRPADPYSVNLWMIAEAQQLFVYAGDNHSDWAQHIDVDPNVRIKIDQSIYELSASRVTEQPEFARFAEAWFAKYGSDRRNVKVGEVYLYRLHGRG